MTPEIWAKLLTDVPILGVLILVLWKGGEKLDRLTDKFTEKTDKLGEKLDRVSSAVRNLSGKVELIGRLQDVRLDLHEERTSGTGQHAISNVNAALTLRAPPANGGPTSHRSSVPSWPDTTPPEDED